MFFFLGGLHLFYGFRLQSFVWEMIVIYVDEFDQAILTALCIFPLSEEVVSCVFDIVLSHP